MIYQGDALEVLKTMPAETYQMCVTSPPYWRLRDYGVEGQLGLEPTMEEFIDKMVQVFREVRRVLKDDGTLWVNIGDSYASSGKERSVEQSVRKTTLQGGLSSQKQALKQIPKIGNGLKRKDLCGVPWRLALALQAGFCKCTSCGLEQRTDLWPRHNGHKVCLDCIISGLNSESRIVETELGFYLRQCIIWSKPNPMPESVTDRCTNSHEYIFLLSKSEKYFFDAAAIKEPANLTGKGFANGFRGGAYVNNSTFDNAEGGKRTTIGNRPSMPKGSFSGKTGDRAFRAVVDERNKRSVWTIATEAYPDAHFATFPRALVLPCILAGSKHGDRVLDPFIGTGTTREVAVIHGRECDGIEINPETVKLAENRMNGNLFQYNAEAGV